jgi:hypothetical protein
MWCIPFQTLSKMGCIYLTVPMAKTSIPHYPGHVTCEITEASCAKAGSSSCCPFTATLTEALIIEHAMRCRQWQAFLIKHAMQITPDLIFYNQ